MVAGGDLGLGFQGTVVAILFVPLIFLLARWRWRVDAERKAEVRRLAFLAAEEELRAEMEASREFAAVSSARVPAAAKIAKREAMAVKEEAPAPRPEMVCAFCHNPGTKKCSRCKAVRYCSGKCQILHWRQHHKDECYISSTDEKSSDQLKTSSLQGKQAEQFGPTVGDSKLEEAVTVQVKTFPKHSAPSVSTDITGALNGDGKLKEKSNNALRTSDSSTANSSRTKSSKFPGTATPQATAFSDEPILHDSSPDHLASFKASSSNHVLVVDEFDSFASSALDPEKSNTYSAMNNSSNSSHFIKKLSMSESEADNDHLNNHKLKAAGGDEAVVVPLPGRKSQPAAVCTPASGLITEDLSVLAETKTQSKHEEVTRASRNDKSGSAGDLTTDSLDSRKLKPKSIVDKISTNSKGQSAATGAPSSELTTKNLPNLSISADSKSGRQHGETTMTSSINSSVSAVNSTTDSSDSKKLKPKASVDQILMDPGHNAFAVPSSSVIGTASKVSRGSIDDKGPVPNGESISVKGVVEHGTISKLSRVYHSELMLFPYDVFIKLYNDKAELRPCGLINFGNSCYANAVLQCLTFTRPLTAYLLEGFHSNKCRKNEWCFTCEFESLLANVKQGKSPLAPTGILSNLNNIGSNFGLGNQEDAHEFLRYAIDAMQSVCLKEAGVKPGSQLADETTLIQQTFGGYLQSKIKCSRCKGKSERCERMMDLTVEIHGNVNTLEEALHRFTSSEILDGENKYKCDRCKSYERARKKLSILEAPNILTIALKRFQSGSLTKLNKTVRFQEYLDLAPFMSSTDDKCPVYRLYAVVIHINVSNSSSSGHYVCCVKDTKGRWYNVDDSKVRPVELDKVLSEDAYMLLYARCSPHAPRSVRKAMASESVLIKRTKDKDFRGKQNSIFRHPLVPHRRNPHYPSQVTDDHLDFQSLGLFQEGTHPFFGDYSSDNSSLFSHSDLGSCITDSTMDSTSTEEYWENLSSSSPLRDDRFTNCTSASSQNSDAVVSKQSSGLPRGTMSNVSPSREDDTVVESLDCENFMDSEDYRPSDSNCSSSLLYPDNIKQCRNLTEHRTLETNWGSGVLFRTSDRTQTFY